MNTFSTKTAQSVTRVLGANMYSVLTSPEMSTVTCFIYSTWHCPLLYKSGNKLYMPLGLETGPQHPSLSGVSVLDTGTVKGAVHEDPLRGHGECWERESTIRTDRLRPVCPPCACRVFPPHSSNLGQCQSLLVFCC